MKILSITRMLTTHTFCVTHAHITHSHSHVYSHLATTTFSILSPSGSQGCLKYHLTEEGHCCLKLFQHTINFVRLLVTLEKREGACALFVQKTPDLLDIDIFSDPSRHPSSRDDVIDFTLSTSHWFQIPILKKHWTHFFLTLNINIYRNL